MNSRSGFTFHPVWTFFAVRLDKGTAGDVFGVPPRAAGNRMRHGVCNFRAAAHLAPSLMMKEP